jgi:hypothetical protein
MRSHALRDLVERAPAVPRLLLVLMPLGAVGGAMFLPWGFAAAALAAMVVTAELTLFLARLA